MMFYQVFLGALLAVNSLSLWSRYRTKTRDGVGITGSLPNWGVAHKDFQLSFFVPYTLAVAADWLQVRTATKLSFSRTG